MNNDLVAVCRSVRRRIVELSYRGRVPHLGSALSCVEIVVAAYFGSLRIDPCRPLDPDRDIFILSKGHAATALYAVLLERGFFTADVLEDLGRDGSRLGEHPTPGYPPGVELATGSLGHGLSVGAGLALAARMNEQRRRVVVLVSDGECNEGATWEAAMFAAGKSLSNLTVVVDANGWQATGRSAEILALEPLRDKWASFGWRAEDCDGHDVEHLVRRLSSWDDTRPTAIVARTVKGCGVSFMEDDNNWHYRIPNNSELDAALSELAGDPRSQPGK